MNSACKSGGHTSVLLQTAAAALLAIASGQAMAASVTLCAEPYTVDLPGVSGVPMWGYRQVTDAASCSATSAARATAEAPVLSVPAGDTTLAITLVNRLTVPTSIVLSAQALATDGGAPVSAVDLVGPSCDPAAGTVAERLACRVRSFTGETDPGASRTYTFTNLRPGSFLYQSGTHPQVQVQMGLAGLARVVGTGDAGFDRDVPVVLSEVDADMHGRIAATLGGADPTTWKAGNNSTLNYAPRFFLVNGRVFSGIDGSGAAATDLAVSAASGWRVGLRIANAGLQSRTLMLTNGTWKLLGEDGHAYAAPREQATVLVPAGKSTDALIIANVPASGVDRSVALFDRRGGTDNADGTVLGGQVARVAQSAPVGPLIDPIGPQVANEGGSLALQVLSANITGGFTPVTTAPAMTISPAGLISWAVPTGTTVPTAYDVTVSGGDGATTVAQTFNVRVNHAPTIAATGPVAVSHGTVTVPAPGVLAGAADPDGDALSAVSTAPPSAGTLALNANGSYTWSGPQPASGTMPVTLSVASRDTYGLQSAPTTVTLNVAANVAPVAANVAALATPLAITLKGTTTAERRSLAFQLTPPSPLMQPYAALVTASDADGQVIPASFASSVVRVNSGTGVPIALPAGYTEASAVVSADGSTITFAPRHQAGLFTLGLVNGTFSSLGVYRITYTVRDDQGLPSNTAVTFVQVF